MSVRSVISVDVDQSQWLKFQTLFQAYHKQVNAQPAAWSQINAGARNTTLTFERMAALMASQTQMIHSNAMSMAKMGSSSRGLVLPWESLAKSTKSVASNLVDATRSLMSWGRIVGLVSGLLGAGGLFGITRLATSSVNQARAAVGSGTTVGKRAAFGIEYGNAINDPDSILNKVNDLKTSAVGRGRLAQIGLSGNDMHGDSADVSLKVLEHLKRIADNGSQDTLTERMHAFGADEFATKSQMQQLHNMTPAELAEHARGFKDKAGRLDLDKNTTGAWDKLKMQLAEAGAEIENTFTKGLTKLAGPIGDLSEAMVKATKSLLGSEAVKDGIEALAHGIEWLSTELQSKEFQNGVKTFSDDVIALAKVTGRAVSYIASFFPNEKTKEDAKTPGTDEYNRQHLLGEPGAGYEPGVGPQKNTPLTPDPNPPGASAVWHAITGMFQGIAYKRFMPQDGEGGGGRNPLLHEAAYRPDGGSMGFPSVHSLGSRTASEDAAHDYFRKAGWDEPETAGILSQFKGESGFDINAFNGEGGGQGAQGIAQWRGPRIDAFRKMFGHDPRGAPLQEQLEFYNYELTQGSEKGVGDQLKQIHNAWQAASHLLRNDERPGAAAIASGEGQRGSWANGYEGRYRYGGQHTKILIQNETAANVITRASQLAT